MKLYCVYSAASTLFFAFVVSVEASSDGFYTHGEFSLQFPVGSLRRALQSVGRKTERSQLHCPTAEITVPKNDGSPTIFHYPEIDGVKLDYCARKGAECGQAAADVFCKDNGFEQAAGFGKWSGIGSSMCNNTSLIGTKEVCSKPEKCDAFTQIECVGEAPFALVDEKEPAGGKVDPMWLSESVEFKNPTVTTDIPHRTEICSRHPRLCEKRQLAVFCASKGFDAVLRWESDKTPKSSTPFKSVHCIRGVQDVQ